MTAAIWAPNGGRLNSYLTTIGEHTWTLSLRAVGWMMSTPVIGDVFVAPVTADTDVALAKAAQKARRTA